jgi:hypothetical protein
MEDKTWLTLARAAASASNDLFFFNTFNKVSAVA